MLAMHMEMDHSELNPESGKVVQSLKRMCVDGGADVHHHRPQLNEVVTEYTTQKEARQLNIAVNSGTANKMKAILAAETSPGKVMSSL